MKTTGKVTGIVSNLVTVEANGPVSQNEICYITVGDTKLMAEVIKVNGKYAAVQVFESTRNFTRCVHIFKNLLIAFRSFAGAQDDIRHFSLYSTPLNVPRTSSTSFLNIARPVSSSRTSHLRMIIILTIIPSILSKLR